MEQYTSINKMNRKVVDEFDLTGGFIRSYESMTEASKVSGANRANIIACCKGRRRTTNGSIWKYS